MQKTYSLIQTNIDFVNVLQSTSSLDKFLMFGGVKNTDSRLLWAILLAEKIKISEFIGRKIPTINMKRIKGKNATEHTVCVCNYSKG